MQRRNVAYPRAVLRGSCTAGEVVGNAVYIAGPPVGGIYPVRQADCEDLARMPVAGVVIRKLSVTECFFQNEGLVEGVLSGLVPGRDYRVGKNGVVLTGPSFPPVGGYALVQFVGKAYAPDVLWLNVEAISCKVKEL